MLKRRELYESGTYDAVIAHPHLSPSTKLVYVAMVRRLGKNSSTWPTHDLLAEDTHLTTRTVERAAADLVRHEIISRVGKKGRANQYVFHEVKPEPDKDGGSKLASGPDTLSGRNHDPESPEPDTLSGRATPPTLSRPDSRAPEPDKDDIGTRQGRHLDPTAVYSRPDSRAPEPDKEGGLTPKELQNELVHPEPKKEFAQRIPSPVAHQDEEINCDELMASAAQMRGSSLRSLPHKDEQSIVQEGEEDERNEGMPSCSSPSHPVSLLDRIRQHHKEGK